MPDLIHTALARTAARFPDKPVFRIPGGEITYAAFAESVAGLAGTLRDLSVRRGDRVAVHFRKSIESAIAIYAVMRAGAAYVPIDPASPAERTRSILRTCGARVMITQEALARKLPDDLPTELDGLVGPQSIEAKGPRVVGWSDALSASPGAESVQDASEDDLAYIIFTSGSTGEPKGIVHTHATGLAYSRMAAALYNIVPNDRLTGISPLHFDMSTLDYLCGPQCGTTTTIIPDPYLKLPASLSELVEEERITIWYSVPFALTQVLLHGALEERDLTSIRWVLFGGEPFAPKHLAALTEALPDARFSNVFGPAESNQCTYYHLPGRWKAADGQPPVGVSCPHARTRLVDETLKPVEQGAIGEMIVCSPAIMKGYWKRPDLNEKVLVHLPDGASNDETWLRTGDLASVRPDGLYAFHGRADRMAKVRGFRVELDEIEDVLSDHRDVEEASAFSVSLEQGHSAIQAAVTLLPEASVGADELRAHLAERLPSYSIPDTIDIVQEFPRTSSGKINWKRLSEEASVRESERG